MKLKYILLLSSFFAVHTMLRAQAPQDDKKIEITFLQLNDVYEISALDNGTVGGMSRVATVRNKLVKENANTYTVLSGDFLFPSALGTILFEGKQIKGQQMIEVMNTAGVDLVTFGNHEFDLNERDLSTRLNESSFDWVSSNVLHHTASGNIPFTKVERHSENAIPASRILFFKDADGTTLRIGVFAVTINSTPQDYVVYTDFMAAADKAIKELKDHCDFIVAITHLSVDDDKKLAARFPEIKLILGGHEHVNSYDTVGTTIISKADANAKTVYVHKMMYDTDTKQLHIRSALTNIDQSIPDDPATKQVVDKWTAIADKSLREQGFDPTQVLATLNEEYDGREESIRYISTNLTRMVARAFTAAAPGTDCAIYNSGAIRIDDELKGTITQYDIIRTLPYGGKIVIAEMKGSLIDTLLNISFQHPGNGCFLQYDQIESRKGRWLINGKPLKPNKVYRVAINDYLVSGKQQFMEFLSKDNPFIISLSYPEASDPLRYDIRQAVIHYLRNGGK